MAKILVIGSNAFGGASYVKYARDAGHDVIACSRSLEAPTPYLPYKWFEHESAFEFHQVDLNHDMDKLKSLIDKHKPNVIVNFASLCMVAQSWDTPEDWMQTNVVSTTSLMQALRHLDFLDKYIHFTTPEVYGNTDDWVKESMNFKPSTPYALSRAAGDMIVELWRETYDIPAIYTRASNIYGEGQQVFRIVPKTILCALGGEKLQLHGGGTSLRSFIHMQDVSDALELIIQKASPGESYHISPQEAVSIRELVEMICKQMGVAFNDVVEMADDRLGKDMAYLLNSDFIREKLGWQEKISLEQGISRCIGWVENFEEDLRALPPSYQHKK